MATALLDYWAVRVGLDRTATRRVVAAIEIARARIVGNPAGTPVGAGARRSACSARPPGSGRWAVGADVALAVGRDAAATRRCERRHPGAGSSRERGNAVATVFTGGDRTLRRWFDEASSSPSSPATGGCSAWPRGFAGAGLARYDPVAAEASCIRAEDAARRIGQPVRRSARVGDRSRPDARRHGRTDAAVAALGIAIARFAELGDERLGLACAERRSPMPSGAAAGCDEALATVPRDDQRLGPPRPPRRRRQPARERRLRGDRPGTCRIARPACSGRPRPCARTPTRRWRSTRSPSWGGSSIGCGRCCRPRRSTPRGGPAGPCRCPKRSARSA